MKKQQHRLTLAAALLAASCAAAAADVGINVYGLSYHFERDVARELGSDNELNLGAGVRVRSGRWFADAGAYRDSGRNTASLAGIGYVFLVSERWRIGGALTAMHSHTYNQGDAFIAPVPVVAYETEHGTLNFTFFPKIVGFNEINTLGLWFTFYPEFGG